LKNSKIKIPSNKSFGLVFFIFFIIISLYPLVNKEEIRVWSLIVSLIFLLLGLIDSKILTPLNKIWFKIGIYLGNIVSPIVMGIIFFFVVTPTGIIMKLLGKDILNIKYSKNNSYWIKKNGIKSKMKNQF